MTTPCPKSFLKVGTLSVVLRHALFDVDQHYKALAQALEATHKDLEANKIARMEIAAGELLVAEASTAVLKVMAAHDSWRAMCERHGIATPTDNEILETVKGMGLKSAAGSHLEKLASTRNLR